MWHVGGGDDVWTARSHWFRRNGQTLFEICSRLTTKHHLGSSRQAISQHLDVLETAGLVETGREGRCLGVRFTQEPVDMGPVTTAVLDDTCGNLIQIAHQAG
ncbi:helix-turn-helix domain-containing protein [Actinomadura sp. HBU206391]|uniref:helix-turn-helix domain-containing protein n=1 Tax=Actinomadura sp. HBU206391 TaxID=2731692 RepID=UPI00164F0D1B|nr:helix-turn-helix domain-containing protein [Actinomadura sp. HBU206391]MBC6461574.1 helix-turn-helix domain-containing protein [Actinomadura sp. HBU206391]